MTCNILEQNPELQLELCDLISDFKLKSCYLKGIDLLKAEGAKKYPSLPSSILRIYSMFGSTYICESSFLH